MIKKEEEQFEMDFDLSLEERTKIIEEEHSDEEICIVKADTVPHMDMVSLTVGIEHLIIPFEDIAEVIDKLIAVQKEVEGMLNEEPEQVDLTEEEVRELVNVGFIHDDKDSY